MEKTIHKLHEARYGTKFVFHTGNTETLKTICFAYFYCIMKYTLIMWRISSYSKKTFTLQWKVQICYYMLLLQPIKTELIKFKSRVSSNHADQSFLTFFPSCTTVTIKTFAYATRYWIYFWYTLCNFIVELHKYFIYFFFWFKYTETILVMWLTFSNRLISGFHHALL